MPLSLIDNTLPILLESGKVIWMIFTLREAIASPSIGNTLWRVWAVITRSAITPPEVNGFGRALEHSEYIVCRWPCQILGAIRIEARARERGESLLFCEVGLNNAQVYRNLHTRCGSVPRWILSEPNFENLPAIRLFYKQVAFRRKYSTTSDFRRL